MNKMGKLLLVGTERLGRQLVNYLLIIVLGTAALASLLFFFTASSGDWISDFLQPAWDFLKYIVRILLIILSMTVGEELFDTALRLGVNRQNFFVGLMAWLAGISLFTALLGISTSDDSFLLTFFGDFILVIVANIISLLIYKFSSQTMLLWGMFGLAFFGFIFGIVIGYISDTVLVSTIMQYANEYPYLASILGVLITSLILHQLTQRLSVH